VKLVLRVFAWMAILPYAAVAWLVVTGIATWSAVLYVVAGGVLLGGLATLPLDQLDPSHPPPKRRRPRGVSRGAAAVIVAVAAARTCSASHGRTLALAAREGGGARIVDRVVDESDLAVAGTRALVATGMLRDDARELPGAMRAAYERFHAEEGDAPSPVAATYLGLERPSAFDLVVVDPLVAAPPRDAVVFLHGFGGGFDLPCWQIARAVAPDGVITACPSTGWQGDWSSPDGAAILARTVALLHARGVERIVLVGLSNGGVGASHLAPRMAGAFAGLVLVSGADPEEPPPGIPTLVLHGRHDTMMSAAQARRYATHAGAKYVDLDAGHFAMLVRATQADREIRDFVGSCLRLPGSPASIRGS
jgi:pimeloyl-ACP methyl ester carboxylesterase